MDYAELQKEFGGQYIAMIKDRLIAHGQTFREALEKVRSLGQIENEELTFRFIQPKEGICVY